MRRPVSIRRNHRTRDESRHREPHWPDRVPRVLSSRARLAVRKSFQTLETMENTIQLNGGERNFPRDTTLSISTTRYYSFSSLPFLSRFCRFDRWIDRFFRVLHSTGSFSNRFQSFESSPIMRSSDTTNDRARNATITANYSIASVPNPHHDGCNSRATSLRTNHELFAAISIRTKSKILRGNNATRLLPFRFLLSFA